MFVVDIYLGDNTGFSLRAGHCDKLTGCEDNFARLVWPSTVLCKSNASEMREIRSLSS